MISIGNMIIMNPSDKDRERALEYKRNQQQERLELDNRVFAIIYICQLKQDFLSIDELGEYYNEICEISDQCIKLYFGGFIHPTPKPYKIFQEQLIEIINLKSPSWYMIPVTLSSSEKVNGYDLHDLNEEINNPFFRYPDFVKLESLYNTPNSMVEFEFLDKYQDEACSEWSKQDECGECYGGYWKFPEGSYERENAYNLSREANGKALYKLPYSHDLIFKTIHMGCCNRMESVKYSNTICEYVKRKLANKNNNDTSTDNVKTLRKIKVVAFLNNFSGSYEDPVVIPRSLVIPRSARDLKYDLEDVASSFMKEPKKQITEQNQEFLASLKSFKFTRDFINSIKIFCGLDHSNYSRKLTQKLISGSGCKSSNRK